MGSKHVMRIVDAVAKERVASAKSEGIKIGMTIAVSTLYRMHGNSTAMRELYRAMDVSSEKAEQLGMHWDAKQLAEFEKENK